MKRPRGTVPRRHIETLRAPSAPRSWDLALMMVLALFGLSIQPVRR